jgi:hypothetical protein
MCLAQWWANIVTVYSYSLQGPCSQLLTKCSTWLSDGLSVAIACKTVWLHRNAMWRMQHCRTLQLPSCSEALHESRLFTCLPFQAVML